MTDQRRPIIPALLAHFAILALVVLAVSAVSAVSASAVSGGDATPAPPAESGTGAEAGIGAGAGERVAVTIDEAVARGVEIILELREGTQPETEWPYEGVYRVRGQIPIGYRVGGTAIAATALVRAPGYAEDEARQKAVHDAAVFITGSIGEPNMEHEFDSRYDVRGWGYAYGLSFLLLLEREKLVPADLAPTLEPAIRFFIDGIAATSIPENGGWNYARRGGFDRPGPPSPFMTGPTLQALFAATRQGHDVDVAIVHAGLDALANARTPTGSFVYSGAHGARSTESVPGSVGRMLVAEVTLLLAGRSTVQRVRGAIDAFIVHWEWLDKRRARNGTHIKPYGIAPYYFYFAHYQAAQAVELLPEHERDEYRRRINDLLFSVRLEDGRWNDRVFSRTANYGTSMAVLALLMPNVPAPAGWTGEPEP